MSVLMVDGTTADVPAILARFGPQQPVAGYVTGPGVEWPNTQFALFARKIRIAQSWVPAIDVASDARCLDIETGAARAQDWPGFYDSRTDKPRATCYCSLFTVPRVIATCKAANRPLPPRFWLAWYPSQPVELVPATVLAELERLTDVVLPPALLWAWQYAAFAEWDLSRVFGAQDFSRQ